MKKIKKNSPHLDVIKNIYYLCTKYKKVKQVEPLRFYDNKCLAVMSNELLSAYLHSDQKYTRSLLGCPKYQTQIYNQYSESQKVLILKNSVARMASIIETTNKDLYINELEEKLQQYSDEILHLRQENQSIRQKSSEDMKGVLQQLKKANNTLENMKRAEKRKVANSENSSLPPSQNTISEKARIKKQGVSLREKSNKPNGGQLGHKGKTADRMKPDIQMNVYPDKTLPNGSDDCTDVICPNCGTPIPRSLFKERDVHQVIDILDSIKAKVVDFTRMEAICPNCKQKVSGQFDAYTHGRVNYGPHLQAFVTLMSVRHSVASNRICELISDLFGLKINEGTIFNMLQRQTEYSRPYWYKLKEDVGDAENGLIAVHADETHCGYLYERKTTIGENGNNDIIKKETPESSNTEIDNITSKQVWIWTFQNSRSVFLIQSLSRSSDLINNVFDIELLDKILITDRYKGYFMKTIDVGGHQICLVHLLRNIKSKQEAYPKYIWLKTFFETIQLLIHKFNQGEDKSVLHEKYQTEIHSLLYEKTDPNELPDKTAVNEIDRFKKELRK